MVVLGKGKRNDKNFCYLSFVCLSADDNKISFWTVRVPTNYHINRNFFERIKDGESR